ncbi:hypothetical protein GALMADRAFT_1330752 [Galerina marginata CBS 339.88]|uniref:F-box domain-containing protein n=1 Tax=Galerina marginata (strain CBS 339.88) TaxID=685588 RepID=A0A067SZZ6_GALM3|nr:hypothetical protein GALMADRAFT_1330752 [Galerina marginata CBS 339.88]
MTLTRTSTLPPEVWDHILGDLPQPQVPKLLEVCSMFHDIALRSLFSSIKIYFIGGTLGMQMLNTTHADWIDETAIKLMCKSWEMLNHICQDRRFARVVKSITVIAFADGQSIFERLTVANALLFMPNLQTFRWIGTGPAFDDIVAECLPPNLKKLVIQSSLPFDSIRHLTDVTTLHLSMPFFFPDDEEAHDRLVYDPTIRENLKYSIAEIVESIAPALQSLRVTATQLRDAPIRMLNTLIDLEVFATIGDEEELVGLDVVFRHATLLQSLTLVGLFVPATFSFLPHSSTGCLPLLNSFRLSCEDPSVFRFGEDEFQSLCGLLQGRPLLRRLYLRLPTMDWMQTSRLLCIVRELDGLEVLGFHTGRDMLADDTIETLSRSLSKNLHALHIAINWAGVDLLPLLDTIAKLPHLSFLHLYGAIARLPILLEDLAFEAEGLKTIGLNRALWTIDRVGAEITSAKWPRWKIKFCVEEDFVSADDAWLFKYN